MDSTTKLQTTLEGDLGTVTFRDGHLWAGGENAPVTETHTGRHDAKTKPREFSGSYESHCTAADRSGQTGDAALVPEFPSPLTEEGMILRLTNKFEPQWGCTGNGNVFGATGGWRTEADFGKGPMDVTLRMPFEALTQGKILARVESPAVQLPGGPCLVEDPHHGSQRCTFTYEGWVTFVRTAQRTVGEPPVQPTPSPDPNPTPTPPPAAKPKPRATKAKLDRRAKRLTVDVACPAGCRGDATLKAGSQSTLLRFDVPAGGPRAVTLDVPAKVARSLRRSGRGDLAVSLASQTHPAVVARFGLRVR